MRSRVIVLGSLCVGAVACDATPSPTGDCTEVRAPDGWVDAQPPEWVELWSSGGPDESVELAFPVSFNPGPDGRLALVDFQLGLSGVDPNGAWVGSLTRPGQGPGEVGMPLAAAYADDGTLAILDFGNGKVVFLDGAGELVRESRVDRIPLDRVLRNGELNGLSFMSDGTALLLERTAVPTGGEIRQSLLRLPPDGSPADTIVTALAPAMGSENSNQIAPGWARLVFASSPDGRIAFAGHEDGFRIRVLEPGDGGFDVCRNITSTPLRPDEIEPPPGLSTERAEVYAEALASAPRPETPAAFSRLILGREGRLWVERERFGLADGPAAFTGRPGSRFDLFDADGRYLGELRAPDGVHVMAAAGDTVWGLEYGAFDVPSVIAFELRRAGGDTP